jgi:hypothetical protein
VVAFIADLTLLSAQRCYILQRMSTSKKATQINFRADSELRRKIAELQRLDRGSDKVPSVGQVIRNAIEDAYERARKGK